jgi:hypothetical protein
LSLFDKMVKPILLYGYEIWGSGNKLWGVRPLPNMTILVLSMLTLSFQVKQYSWKTSSSACKSHSDSDNVTVSSAYSIINNLK